MFANCLGNRPFAQSPQPRASRGSPKGSSWAPLPRPGMKGHRSESRQRPRQAVLSSTAPGGGRSPRSQPRRASPPRPSDTTPSLTPAPLSHLECGASGPKRFYQRGLMQTRHRSELSAWGSLSALTLPVFPRRKPHSLFFQHFHTAVGAGRGGLGQAASPLGAHLMQTLVTSGSSVCPRKLRLRSLSVFGRSRPSLGWERSQADRTRADSRGSTLQTLPGGLRT